MVNSIISSSSKAPRYAEAFIGDRKHAQAIYNPLTARTEVVHETDTESESGSESSPTTTSNSSTDSSDSTDDDTTVSSRNPYKIDYTYKGKSIRSRLQPKHKNTVKQKTLLQKHVAWVDPSRVPNEHSIVYDFIVDYLSKRPNVMVSATEMINVASRVKSALNRKQVYTVLHDIRIFARPLESFPTNKSTPPGLYVVYKFNPIGREYSEYVYKDNGW